MFAQSGEAGLDDIVSSIAHRRHPWLLDQPSRLYPLPRQVTIVGLITSFCVEGPMTDARSWEAAVRFARNIRHRIVCGPTGADRDALAAEFRGAHKNLAGVPPGT